MHVRISATSSSARSASEHDVQVCAQFKQASIAAATAATPSGTSLGEASKISLVSVIVRPPRLAAPPVAASSVLRPTAPAGVALSHGGRAPEQAVGCVDAARGRSGADSISRGCSRPVGRSLAEAWDVPLRFPCRGRSWDRIRERNMSAEPRARSEGIITEEVGDELVVYLEATPRRTRCLRTRRRCGGAATVTVRPRRSPAASGLSRRRSRGRSTSCGRGADRGARGISRRAVQVVAELGAAAVRAPLIYSVAVRPASAAASTVGCRDCLEQGFATCSGTPQTAAADRA